MSLTQIDENVNPEIKLLASLINFRQQYGATLNGRLDRGWQLADAGNVTQLDETTWRVASQSGPQIHTVIWADGKINCSCWDGRTGAPAIDCLCGSKTEHSCKHVVAVALVWTAGLVSTSPQVHQAQPISDASDAVELSQAAQRKLEEMIDHARERNALGQKSLDAAFRNFGPKHSAGFQFTGQRHNY